MPPGPQDVRAKQDANGGGERRLSGSGTQVMAHAVRALGIEPSQVPATGAVQVVARRPEGALEPLIWVENFNPSYKKTYYFQAPQRFPAGTRIEVSPPQASVALVVK